MKPLVVLLGSFAISLVAIKLLDGGFDYLFAGRIAMAIMLMFTAIGHFKFTRGMAMMVPDFIPYKNGMVYLTGVIEIIAAAGLLIPNLQILTGWSLILFFIALTPGNIKAAIQHVDFEKGTLDGKGPSYLWFRIPLQVLFIIWTYFNAIAQ